jgi:hypothetical protein
METVLDSIRQQKTRCLYEISGFLDIPNTAGTVFWRRRCPPTSPMKNVVFFGFTHAFTPAPQMLEWAIM